MTSSVRLTFHKDAFFELAGNGRTLFVDPVFSQERRNRRVAGDVRPADYVLLTSVTPWYDDALDVLDACTGTLVASPRLCRQVQKDLDVDRDRLLDLEPWERASEEGLRITVVPISVSAGMEGAIDEGASILQDISGIFPSGLRKLPLVGMGADLLETGMRTGRQGLGSLSSLPRPRSLDRATEILGMDVQRIARGRPGLGFHFQFAGFPTLLHLADGIHAGTSQQDLDDIAQATPADVLLVQIDGATVEPLVRAVRTLKPKTVLLYRSRDPYAEDRRSPTLPANAFMDALAEDAPKVEVVLLRKGDSWLVENPAVDAPA